MQDDTAEIQHCDWLVGLTSGVSARTGNPPRLLTITMLTTLLSGIVNSLGVYPVPPRRLYVNYYLVVTYSAFKIHRVSGPGRGRGRGRCQQRHTFIIYACAQLIDGLGHATRSATVPVSRSRTQSFREIA